MPARCDRLRETRGAGRGVRRRRAPRRRTLEMLLDLLPERLPRSGLAVVHEGADGLAELVERYRPDGDVALRDPVAIHPVGEPLLVVRIEREKLLARDLIHLLLLGLRA